MKQQTEFQLQRAVAQFLDRALPPDAFWTSIDSAGRGPIQGARMKARGVKRGLPDILVIHERLALWLELKSATGRVTPEQRDFALRSEKAGMPMWCCRSLAEVEKSLLHSGIPLRCKVSA